MGIGLGRFLVQSLNHRWMWWQVRASYPQVDNLMTGFIEFFENLSGPKVAQPKWAAPRRLEVDGKRYQDGSTATMVYGVAFLVSYLSRFMSLQPGDIISTGTPPGVGLGQKPPVYLRAGQTMRLGIDGLGEQRQRTVAA